MNTYCRNYAHRAKEITVTLIILIVSIVLVLLLFGSRLKSVSDQLRSYDTAQYNYTYVLNYSVDEDEVYLYPDVDVLLYTDQAQMNRMTVSSLMWTNNGNHTILKIEQPQENQVVLSENVASKYQLSVGDRVYAVYPFSTEPVELSVSAISDVEYDYSNPKISNDIGMVYLPYSEEYEKNTNSKYTLFSENSAAELLTPYTQIIDGVINKSESYENVMGQGTHILIFELLFVVAALYFANSIFFKKSIPALRRIFLKGANKGILVWVPFLEKLIFGLLPVIITCWISSVFIPCNSKLTMLFYLIPTCAVILFAIATCIRSLIMYRQRR